MAPSTASLIGFGLSLMAGFPTATAAQAKTWRDFPAQNRTPASCPDFTTYSQQPHAPFSDGPLKLPYMRPSEECRTFISPVVERVIQDITSQMQDPDLARLFENTFPNTLDTTVKYHDPNLNLAFIITGDITAQWLRDTSGQFAHLYKLLPFDENLRTLVKAVIETESRYISQFPYCGAFQPPPESGLAPTHNDWADNVVVNPPVNNQTVFECKYELDSLGGFLKMARSYYAVTEDSSFITNQFKAAMMQIERVLFEQSQGSWDKDWNFVSYYNWTGTPGALSPAVPNSGNGEPSMANGLERSSHRPSDDLVVFPYITSDNAMMSVELENMADVFDEIGTQSKISRTFRQYSRSIRAAVWTHTIANGIFAYETNGYGGMYIMDDANVPSLVSLPYLGFLNRHDPVYKKTKRTLFSNLNPYFTEGKKFQGIGGPHVNATYPWPMSQISGIFGTDDDEEIKQRLGLILDNTSGLGLIHESLSIHNSSDYTRSWFAWANSYFAEMILDLAERKPGLILKSKMPYVIGQGW